MTTFTGGFGNDVADVRFPGTLIGFTGGSLFQLTDSFGDTINGNGGNDRIFSGSGDDIINGGSGNDVINAGDGNNKITGGPGADTMTGGFGSNDFIIGNGEFEAGESISGGFGGGSDRLLVSGTNNFLIGTVSGIDYVIGSAGNDNVTFASTQFPEVTLIDLGQGTDSLTISVTGNLSLTSTTIQNVENITINDNGSAHTITGSTQADVINGNGGNDSLNGGDGADIITGGTGNDSINGGAGTDTAVFSGSWLNYTINTVTGTITDARAGSPDGTDTFTSIENFQFANGTFTLAQIANDAPTDIILSNDSVLENAANGTVVGSLTTTDPDAPLGDTATYTLLDNAGGRFALSGTDIVVADTNLIDTGASHDILVRVTDAKGAFREEIFTITVTPVNDAPVAGDDAAAGNEDTAITTGNVLANDTDIDNTLTPASITAFSQGAHGTVVNNGNGTFTYTPNANFNGTDSFTYTLNDGAGGSDTATVTVTVNPVNDAPVTGNDAAAGLQNTAITTGNVLANDTDVDSTLTPASISAFSQEADGTVASTADATFTYTPNTNFNGTDTFTYTLNDGVGGSATATVTITVTPVNDAPVAGNNAAAGNEDSAITTSNVLTNDTDVDNTLTAASINAFSQGANGTVVNNGSGTFTYTPNANFNATDSFTYSHTARARSSATATVTITVNAVNDAPVAGNNAAAGSEDTAITTGNVLANDSDVDNTLTAASITAFSQGAHGAVVNNGNGTFTYTPNANFSGTDSFTYTLNDGAGGSATATVTVTVNPVNDAPVAGNNAAAGNEDTAITTGNVLANDTDVDNTLTGASITAFSQGAHGTVVNNGNGTFTYTPNANFNGTDTFTYTLNDGAGGSGLPGRRSGGGPGRCGRHDRERRNLDRQPVRRRWLGRRPRSRQRVFRNRGRGWSADLAVVLGRQRRQADHAAVRRAADGQPGRHVQLRSQPSIRLSASGRLGCFGPDRDRHLQLQHHRRRCRDRDGDDQGHRFRRYPV